MKTVGWLFITTGAAIVMLVSTPPPVESLEANAYRIEADETESYSKRLKQARHVESHHEEVDDDWAMKFDAEGKFVFNDDFSDVLAMSRGSYLVMREESGDEVREAKLTLDRDKSLDFECRLNGETTDFEGEMREWFEDRLPRFAEQIGN